MIQAKSEMGKAEWQVTATTIFCDYVQDYVTLTVNSDWTAKCVWFTKYKQAVMDDPKKKFQRDIKSKIDKCMGPECHLVFEYVDKLYAEEAGNPA